MSSMNDGSQAVTLLTPQQIETLQQQIRQFKNLGRKFSDSKIPKLIEALQPHQPATQPAKTIAKEATKEVTAAKETAPAPISTTTAPPPAAAAQPALSWQCFNSLLFCGPNKFPQEGSISFSSSDFGCFMKSAHLPLVVTAPYAAALREKTLLLASKAKLLSSAGDRDSGPSERSSSMDVVQQADDLISSLSERTATSTASTAESPLLWVLQRKVRAALVKQHMSSLQPVGQSSAANQAAALNMHPPVSLGPTNYVSDLLAYRNFYRTRKQMRRDVKAWEKEDRRRRLELEDKRKKKALEYHKALLSHREDFFRFHKGRKIECTKTARAVKVHMENLDARKEKDESRAEMRRLQALKENDMEAYANLVQDTKNGRLKFLLNETDSYISTINRMIQEQRVLTPEEEAAAAVEAGESGDGAGETKASDDMVVVSSDKKPMSPRSPRGSSVGAGAGAATSADAQTAAGGAPKKITETTKDYYRSTHSKVESIIVQPTMLKGGQLKEYQLTGLQWLVSLYNNNLNGILADEMGLGKTIQTISLVCYLMEFKNNNGPFLIVVPLSTLSNWVNEFNRWAPDVIKVVYKGVPDERKRLYKEEVEAGQLNVLLTTYEYIMKDKASLRKLAWQYIIVDEGHRMKNAQSKFAQILGTVYQSKHRVLLTGTPLQNDLPELWALLNFLLPTIFSSVDTFDQWFNKPFAAFRNQAAAGPTDEATEANLSQEERMLIVHRLHEVLRPFVLRRVKSQVLDQLPDKVEKVLRCNLSGWQRKMYQSIVHKGLGRKDGKDGAVSGGLNNAIMQMRKVCNHPYLFLRDYVVDEDLIRASGKFALLDRMLPKLKAGGHRVLMFSQMVESMNFLEQFFMLRGYQFLRLDGNTSADERERRVFQFNQPDSQHFIFLLSTRAGGLGINLATADTVIIFDSDWNPMMDAQAQDRAHRIGQKKEVRVFRLLTNSPVEERILARATDKRNLNGLVVEAGRFNVRSNTAASAHAQQENREMMESLLKEWSTGASMSLPDGSSADGGSEEGGDGTDGPSEDDQINEMMAASDAEMLVYQAIDAQYDKDRLEKWRALHLANGSTVIPPLPARLMEGNEKPMWMTEDCWPTKYAMIMKDMMSTSTVAVGTRQGLVAKIAKKKGRRKNADIALELLQQQQYGVADGEGDDLEYSDSDDASNTDQHVVAGKVMRKRKEVQYDDGMTDLQYSRYIEKQQDALSLQASKEKKTDKLSGTIFKDLIGVLNAIQKIKRDDGSLLAMIFLDKPPKAIYPDYYQIIQQPIALKQITLKLRKCEYNYFEEIELDFALMSHNARTYNLDTSPVFQDCEAIRREFYQRSIPLLRKYSVADANNTTMSPLPPHNHLVYPLDYGYHRLLSLDTHVQGGDDGGYSDVDDADYGATPATDKKKGKAGATAGARRKRASFEDAGAGAGAGEYDNDADYPVSAAKKKQRLSTGAGAHTAASNGNGNHGGAPTLSLSLKKRKKDDQDPYSSIPTSAATSMADLSEHGGENPLYLSLSLKGRRKSGVGDDYQ